MLAKALAVAGVFAATVAADGASIISSLETIGNATITLNSSVNSWDGTLLGALPIAGDASSLINDINSGTLTAKLSANLSSDEAVSVYTATVSLQTIVNSTLINIDNHYAEAVNAGSLVVSIFLSDLEQSKNATDSLGAAIIAKVPSGLQAFAGTVISEFDADFDVAIATYSQ